MERSQVMSWPAQLHFAALCRPPLCTRLHGFIAAPTCLCLREWHKARRQALGVSGRPLQLVGSLRGVRGWQHSHVLHGSRCQRRALTTLQPAKRTSLTKQQDGPVCS